MTSKDVKPGDTVEGVSIAGVGVAGTKDAGVSLSCTHMCSVVFDSF